MRHRIYVPLALAATVLLTACSDSEDDTAADGPTTSVSAPQDSGAAATNEPSDTKETDGVASSESTGIDPAAQKYVDAVAAEDLDALVAAFHPDAELTDVGREFTGHDEIRDWADNEVIGGKLTVLKNTPKSDGTTLLVRFAPGGSGGFEANYEFTSRDGLITKLDLQYA